MNEISVNAKTMSSSQLGELLKYDKSETNRKIKDMFQAEIVDGRITSTLRENGQVVEYHLPEIESQMFAAKWNIQHLRKVVEFFVAKPLTQLEMIAGMAGSMVEVERKQNEQAKQIENVTAKIERLETSDKVLSSCPVNAEGITGICKRMNDKYSIPAWAVKEIVRGAYGIRPAGNVQNSHESAKGSTYVIWWTSDITALFKLVAKHCERITPTLVIHNSVSNRFKLLQPANN
tara:strand:- start:167 stop:865 length:699 start_codon:yes stop_codon:yes gene_type:complete